MSTIARDTNGSLYRPFEVKKLSEEGQLSGYGSVFGVEDWYSDIVMPGAFTRSLKERMPRLLWQHDTRQPIGVWTSAKEDEKGLYLEGQLALKTQRGAEAYELLKMGALDGLSIGFSTKVAEYDDKKHVRKLLDVELFEVSPVTFPANEGARVDSVKTLDPHNIRDLEAVLREAGLSRSEAKALLAQGFKALRDAAEEEQKVSATLRDAAAAEGLHASLRRLRAAAHAL